MSENVIKFPKQKIDQETSIPSIEHLKEVALAVKEEQVEEATDIMTNIIIEQFIQAGFPISENDNAIKDLCFLLESTKSLLCKYYGIDHPFHAFADACFLKKEDDLIFIAPTFKSIIMKDDENDDSGSE